MMRGAVLAHGLIRVQPEDFVVEEIPLYEPSGTGDHLYVRFRKRNKNTFDVVRDLAKLWGVAARDIGVAGMKDKIAVTEQTISVPGKVGKERALETQLEDVTILSAELHGNKLRTGHLKGNRFDIVVRDIDIAHEAAIDAAIARIREHGIPNYYGEQRFGHGGGNVARALRWLKGEDGRAPRDQRERKLLVSALQSEIFNGVLRAREEDGTWNQVLEGDVARKEDSGGLFVSEDEATDNARAARAEISPTGPMFGPKMPKPRGKPLELEERIQAGILGDGFPFAKAADYGEGARRTLRFFATEMQSQWEGENSGNPPHLRLRFVLPKGAYATTVLGSFLDLGRREKDEDVELPSDAVSAS